MLFLRNTLFLRFVRLLRKEFLRVRLPLPYAAGEVCLSLLAEAGSGSPDHCAAASLASWLSRLGSGGLEFGVGFSSMSMETLSVGMRCTLGVAAKGVGTRTGRRRNLGCCPRYMHRVCRPVLSVGRCWKGAYMWIPLCTGPFNGGAAPSLKEPLIP